MRFSPLGGATEFGLHSTLFQSASGGTVCVDAGMMFPTDEQPGIDHLVPDFRALATAQVDAYFVTHGHEDHIGALAWALRARPAPIYATPMTLALAKPRLQKYGLGKADLRAIGPGERIAVGTGVMVESLAVVHSVPGALGYVIEADGCRAYVTGDHKGLAQAVPSNIDVMLGDSTGVLREGKTPAEATVTKALETEIQSIDAARRIVVAMFASNVERLQNLMEISARHGRRVAVVGRSLRETSESAKQLGLLRPPAGCEIQVEQASLLIVTGGQGEERAALARIAAGEHPDVKVRSGDVFIFSGRPILGNERAVARVCDRLVPLGAEIRDDPSLHTSGHASRDDLAALIESVRPRCLVPVHGAPRHVYAHAALAREHGAGASFVAQNGAVYEIGAQGVHEVDRLPAVPLYVEQGEIVPPEVVRARRLAVRGGVLSFAQEGVRTAGIAGVSPEELAAAADKGGVDGARRLVRRRTEKKPLVIDHCGEPEEG